MPVLATFTNVAALSIAGNAAGCFAHGLPTTPDWAIYQPTAAGATSPGIIGAAVVLATRAAASVYFLNSGGSATPGEATCQFVHSISR